MFFVVVFISGSSCFRGHPRFSTELIIQPTITHMQYQFLTFFIIVVTFIHSFVDKSNPLQIQKQPLPCYGRGIFGYSQIRSYLVLQLQYEPAAKQHRIDDDHQYR